MNTLGVEGWDTFRQWVNQNYPSLDRHLARVEAEDGFTWEALLDSVSGVRWEGESSLGELLLDDSIQLKAKYAVTRLQETAKDGDENPSVINGLLDTLCLSSAQSLALQNKPDLVSDEKYRPLWREFLNAVSVRDDHK